MSIKVQLTPLEANVIDIVAVVFVVVIFVIIIVVLSLFWSCLLLLITFVKLHSDLRILTQLQLVGVGVDFVFPLEGRITLN